MGTSRWKEKIREMYSGKKLPKKNQLLILLLAGMLIFVVVIPVPDKTEKSGEATTEKENSTADDEEEYERTIERRTEEILNKVEGAGRVSVMITLKSDGQKIVEKDQSDSRQTTSEQDSEGGTREAGDSISEKTSIYEQKTDGTTIPYVSKNLMPEVEGVVVIADGGDNAVVVQNITEAIQALFGVEAHKIKIMKRA